MKVDPEASVYPIITEEVTDRYQNSPASMLNQVQSSGIDIRTHLAGLAMQGLLAANNGVTYPKVTAMNAIIYADALIKELNK